MRDSTTALRDSRTRSRSQIMAGGLGWSPAAQHTPRAEVVNHVAFAVNSVGMEPWAGSARFSV